MNSYKRAFGAAVTTALIGSGLVLGVGAPATATATAPERAPSAAQADVLGVITAPLLSGVGQVGQTLTVAPPVWDLLSPLNVVSNSYQWLRDGVPIPGATALTYAVTTDDAGHQITTRVTGTLLGLIPLVGTALSNGIDIPLPTDPEPDPDPAGPLAPLTLPLLSGIPLVGESLSVSPVVWNNPLATTTVQWLSNGVPIPGATGSTLPLTPDLAGTEITAVITGTLAGVPLVQLLTNGLGIPLVGVPGGPVATAFPIPTGTGKVGSVLTGTAPTWDTTVDDTTYQWQRNTVPIPGATSLTYTVKPEDVGKALRLTATGTKGDAIGTASSATVLGRLGDLLAETAPSISGVARAGNVLTVQPGAWGLGTLPTFGYQWYLDNQPITGATNSQYVVKVTDAGRRLAVLVNVTRLGFTPASAAAGPVTVAKVASRTTLKLLKKTIRQGKAGLLRITLAPGSLRPAGKVKIFDGRRLLKTYTVRLADNGTRIVTLPKLKPGKHKLTARFAGTRATTASKSAPVVLTVTRKR